MNRCIVIDDFIPLSLQEEIKNLLEIIREKTPEKSQQLDLLYNKGIEL